MSSRATPLVDLSGTITAANTSQSVAGANTARRYLRIGLPSTASGSLFVNDKDQDASTTDGKSFELQPGMIFTWEGDPPSNAISVASAVAGLAFEAAEG